MDALCSRLREVGIGFQCKSDMVHVGDLSVSPDEGKFNVYHEGELYVPGKGGDLDTTVNILEFFTELHPSKSYAPCAYCSDSDIEIVATLD